MNDVALEEQRETIAFLSTPDVFGRGDTAVERIDTHLSVVWLAGDRAYKLKRAVRFDYVDFSTSELRRIACEAEVRLNRRTAPALYRGVRSVTREADGSLALGGRGVPLDWLVEMARFDQDTLFDRLAESGRLELALMDGLADAIVQLHADAEPRRDRGGREGMARVIDGNARGFAEQGATVLDQAACERLTAGARAALDRCQDRVEARRRGGSVRWCHGDLHLRNIFLLEGRPTLFDAIEFNEDIACVDVLYDLCFLLMDLWRRDLRSHANAVLNEYFARTADFDGLALLPLFLSCRAAVRAKTSVTAANVQTGERQRGDLHAASRQYLTLAQTFLRPPPVCVIAVGGLSGSGKSTLARGLASGIGPPPGALVLRSDVIRKTLLGVPPSTRLGPAGYSPAISRQVYQTMAERAVTIVKAGHAVIVDAVYGSAGDREHIASVARDAGAPFIGLWLDAPPARLAERLRGRSGDASDATPEILQLQLQAGVGQLDWQRLDGSLDAAGVRQRAEARCREFQCQAAPCS